MLGRPLFSLFSHAAARVQDCAALIMRAVAQGGATAAAPMREAALKEGAMLHHLLTATSGQVNHIASAASGQVNHRAIAASGQVNHRARLQGLLNWQHALSQQSKFYCNIIAPGCAALCADDNHWTGG